MRLADSPAGCGAGRDSYLLAQLVGPEGRVIGVDMTDSQLQVANHYVAWHMDRFGYATPNVRFVKGLIEDLGAVGLADESVDVVVSNCVINLCADKRAVFSEIFRVLKPGGVFFFREPVSDFWLWKFLRAIVYRLSPILDHETERPFSPVAGCRRNWPKIRCLSANAWAERFMWRISAVCWPRSAVSTTGW